MEVLIRDCVSYSDSLTTVTPLAVMVLMKALSQALLCPHLYFLVVNLDFSHINLAPLF